MHDESPPTGTIKSGARMFEILDLLQEHDGLGVSDVAALVGRPKGSVHRYLKTLKEHGYVVQEDGTYHLGLRFLDHGVFARDRLPVYHAAKAKVDALAADLDERAWCLVEQDGVGVFVHEAVGTNAAATDARVGYRTPLHSTSAGKAVLAHLPPSRIEEILDTRGLQRRTDQTIASRERLDRELESIREQGYALNLEESVDGLHAVGAPVVDDEGTVRGALSVAGAAHRMPEERCRNEVAELVLAATNEVELDLTYGRA